MQQFVIRRPGATYGASLFRDDHDETWRMGALVGPGVDENKVVGRVDGTTQLNARAAPNRLIAESRDGGATYGPLRPDTVLIDPADNASMLAAKREVLLFS